MNTQTATLEQCISALENLESNLDTTARILKLSDDDEIKAKTTELWGAGLMVQDWLLYMRQKR